MTSEYNKQNDLTNKLRGTASEFLFAYHWYNTITDSRFQLLQPVNDIGWDWMVAHTGTKIQVKRLSNSTWKQKNNYNTLDLRKNRGKRKEVNGEIKYECGTYTTDHFDYLAVHVEEQNIFCCLPITAVLSEETNSTVQSFGMNKVIRDRKYLTIPQLFSTVAENLVEKPVEKEYVKKYSTSVLSFV